MSLARKRRRWRRWDRYLDYCCRFGDKIAATRGMERAHNQRARRLNARRYVLGPDVDLDTEVVIVDGQRLTNERVEQIVDEVHAVVWARERS